MATAKAMGATPPCVFQNDYSILNRRCDPSSVIQFRYFWLVVPWDLLVPFCGGPCGGFGDFFVRCSSFKGKPARLYRSNFPCAACFVNFVVLLIFQLFLDSLQELYLLQQNRSTVFFFSFDFDCFIPMQQQNHFVRFFSQATAVNYSKQSLVCLSDLS